MNIAQTPSTVPADVTELDVLSVLNPTASWVDYRKNRFGGFLRQSGISLECLTSRNGAEIAAVLQRCKTQVVLNEVWQIEPPVMRDLCARFPDTKFVALYHGSPTNIEFVRDWPKQNLEFLKLSRDFGNAFYGHVMDEGRFLPIPGAKVISLPNVLSLPAGVVSRTRLAPNEPLRVLIGGRNVFIKNIGSQVAAAAVLQERLGIPVVVYLLSNSEREEFSHHFEYLEAFGIPFYYHNWSEWEAYVTWMSLGVDLSMCASLCESFGLIAAESMLLGVPVVGSYATEFIPEFWKANPQDPRSIAKIAFEIVSSYAFHSTVAVNVATEKGERNRAALLKNLATLLR